MRVQYSLSACLMGAVALISTSTPSAHALSAAEVGMIAKSITVRIDGQNPGSGVLIRKRENTYVVLTAAHVVATDDEYEIITADDQGYPIDYSRVKKLPGVDLALVEFESAKTYNTANLGNSGQINSGESVYVSGFPVPTTAITEPIWNFSPGALTANATQPLADGYSLVYTNNTLPGMSGGAVLNEQGELVGVHGRADAEQQVQKTETIYVKTGFNLGIPVNIFLGLVSQVDQSLGFSKPSQPPRNSKLTADDYYIRGGELFQQKKYRDAIANYDQAIQLKPDYAEAINSRGRSRIFLGEEQAALKDFNQAIQLQPNYAVAYLNRGLIRSSTDPSGAISDFDRVIRLQDNYAEAYAARAISHSALRNFDGMITDSTRAIQLKPTLTTAYKNRAVGLWLTGKRAEALADVNNAIQLEPDYAWAYHVRGTFRLEQGDRAGAIADLNKALSLAQQQGIPKLSRMLTQQLQGLP